MAPRLTERQQALAFALGLTLAVGALAAYVLRPEPAPAAPGAPVRASLLVDGGSWRIAYENATTANATAFGLLLEASARLHFEVRWIAYAIPPGVFVTAINGTVNGADGRYWQYWVNGLYGDRAADRKAIVDGDVVLWRFDVPQGGG